MSCGPEFGEQAVAGLALAQGGFVVALLRDIAEEEDDAVVGGKRQDIEPEIERLGIEGFEGAGNALVHRALVVDAEVAVGRDGKLFPDVFAQQISLRVENQVGAAIGKGEAPVAVEPDDGVGGDFEDLVELPGHLVAPLLGELAMR